MSSASTPIGGAPCVPLWVLLCTAASALLRQHGIVDPVGDLRKARAGIKKIINETKAPRQVLQSRIGVQRSDSVNMLEEEPVMTTPS